MVDGWLDGGQIVRRMGEELTKREWVEGNGSTSPSKSTKNDQFPGCESIGLSN